MSEHGEADGKSWFVSITEGITHGHESSAQGSVPYLLVEVNRVSHQINETVNEITAKFPVRDSKYS